MTKHVVYALVPAVGHANFEIKEGTMEYGIGHHGEPGMTVKELKPANEIGKELSEYILNDLELVDGEEIAVIVSGLGGTPLMELYVLYDAIEDYFASRNIKVYKSYVGDYVTSLEMRGAALTVLRLNDEFKQLLEVPVDCVGVKQK